MNSLVLERVHQLSLRPIPIDYYDAPLSPLRVLDSSAFSELVIFPVDLGTARMAAGNQLPEAEDHYKQALAADPKMPGVHVALAHVYLRQGKKTEAVSTMEAGAKAIATR